MNRLGSLFLIQPDAAGGERELTLPECTSRFLAELEDLLGPRDRSYCVTGIDIDPERDRPPHLWYPGAGNGRLGHIIIRLSGNALTDPARARWQLAHECVHLLDPWEPSTAGRNTNWLEEGLASWYQNSRVPEAGHRQGAYGEAQSLLEPFIEGLIPAVRHIRCRLGLRIGEIEPAVLRDHFPGLPEEVAQKLGQPFQQREVG